MDQPEVSTEAQAAQPNPPETAPQPSNLPPMGGGASAQMPAAATQPAAQPVVTPIQPQKRGGLAGIVDDFRDAISGTQQPKMGVDAQGNPYVQHQDLTGAQKWLRVASTALHGAAAGYAAGRGAGHGGDALEAGVQAGDKQVEQRQKQAQDVDEQVRQAKLDKFNFVKLQHDQAAQEWQLQHMKVQAQQQEVEFAQKQIDHEMNDLKSIDLGTYKDPFDFAKVQQQDPNFWKNAYNKQVVSYPELDSDGNRVGVHFFLRDENANARLAPAGTQIATFTPPGKDEEPKLTFVTPTGPMRNDDVTTRNAAATNAYNAFIKQREESKLKEAEAAEHEANASKVPSEIRKNGAEAVKAYAEANKAVQEANKLKTPPADDPSIANLGELIVKGGMTEDQLSRLSKGTQSAVQGYLAKNHPNLNQTSVFLDAAQRKQVNLANNALENLKNIETQLQARPDLLGVINGRISQGKELAGTDDKDLAALNTELDNYALASTGAHGVRAVAARADAKKALLNGFKNGPQGVQASIGAARMSLSNLASAGKPKDLQGNPYVPGQQQVSSPQAQPAPQTHVFDPAAWKAKNPQGDVNAAIAAAKQQGYEVKQ